MRISLTVFDLMGRNKGTIQFPIRRLELPCQHLFLFLIILLPQARVMFPLATSSAMALIKLSLTVPCSASH